MKTRTIFVLLLAIAVLVSAVPVSAAIHKVVFRDEGYALSWMPADFADQVAAYMEGKGFKRVNAQELRQFMLDRLKDRDPSVVVMANDVVPDTVMEPIGDPPQPNVNCLFNKYLDAGGKVIYLADWPAYYIGMPDGTRPAWNDSGAAAALGFWPARWGYNDIRTLTVFNEEGKKWGFTKPWLSARAANPADVDIVLGNPEGRPDAAMPWVKTYNNIGRPGAGFLFIYDFPWGDSGWRGDFNDEDLEQIARVASYLPAGDKPLTTELSGTVVGPTGPMANMRLAFVDEFGTYYIRTDDKGAFKVYAAKGTYKAHVYYRGLLLPIGTFEVKGDPTQTVQLGVDVTDKTPPPAIRDLAVAGATKNSLTVSFTAPGEGTFMYEVRYSLAPITDAIWDVASSVVVEAKAPAGQKETVEIKNLQPLQNYFIAVKAIDANLNASALSNVVSGATEAVPIGDGLKGEYYQWDYATLGGTPDRADVFTPANLVAVRYDAPVNFGWGGGAPHPQVRADDFAVRWTGQVLAPTSEEYTFSVVGDDGVVLWVSDKPINPANPGDPTTPSEGWRLQGDTEWTAPAPIRLEAGKKYYIMFEMYERGGGATARLRWSTPTIPKQAIPAEYLYSGEVEAVGRVSGVVLDSMGKPLGGIPVTVKSAKRTATLFTAADGTFTTTFPLGDAEVTAALGAGLLEKYSATQKIGVEANKVTSVTLTIPAYMVSMSLRAADLKKAGKPGWRFLGTMPEDSGVFEGMRPDYKDYIDPNYKDTGPDKHVTTSTWLEDWPLVPGDAGPAGRAGQPGGIPDNTFWVQRLHFTIPAEMEKAETFVLRDFNMDDINEITAVNGVKIGGEPEVWQWDRNWIIPFEAKIVKFGGQENVLAMVGYEGGGGAGHNLDLGGPTLVAVIPGAPAPTVAKGDLNGDGRVGIPDATIALQIAVGILKPSAQQLAAGDLNGDGRVTIAEVTQILRAAVGLTKLQ